MQRHTHKAFGRLVGRVPCTPDAILALKTVSNWVYVAGGQVRKITAHKRSPR